MNQAIPGPGWHPDPGGTPQFRYWDGTAWTEHLAPFGPGDGPPIPPSRAARGSGVIVAVVAGIVVIALLGSVIAVALGSDNKTPKAKGPATARSIVSTVVTIPAHVFSDVGIGSAGPLPTKLPGPVRTKNGKPRILYMGSEYCPFCATERWAMVAALSRFGTFTNVGITRSAGFPEVYPSTPTFTFHGSTYKSAYITFEGVEMKSNQPDASGSGYAIRDIPTPEQRALMGKYDAPPFTDGSIGGIPFIDFADSYLISGSTYSPQVLQGKSFDEIANAMTDSSTAVSHGAIGSANLITAAICALTRDQPANVCADETIQTLEGELRAESPPGVSSGQSSG